MSSLSFQPIQDGDGLYIAVDGGAQKVSVYWLLLNGTPPAGNLDVSDTWNTYSGCHIFIPADKPIQNLSGFVTTLKQQFNPPQANARWMSWVSDPAGVPGTMISVNANISGTQAQTLPQLSLPVANFSLIVPTGSNLSFNANPSLSPNTPSLQFGNGGGGLITLLRNAYSVNLNPDNGVIIVPLTGAAAGALLFDATWDRGAFYAFFMDNPSSWDDTPGGSETRFFYGPAGSIQTLRYPVFPPEAQSQDPTLQLALNVSLDPLNVWDSERTLFALDVSRFAPQQSGGPALPTSDYFRSTDGHVLHLVPQQGAGYALGLRPQGPSTDNTDSYSYLTPVGLFNAQRPAGLSGSLASSDPTAIQHAMCGLTGTEYLLVAPGATVEFVTGNNAYAMNFTPPSSVNAGVNASQSDPCNPGDGGEPVVPGHLLTDDFTTSWVRINPSSAPPGGIDYGYAVQPEASVYYSTVQKPSPSGLSTPYTYPLALGCRVSVLEEGAPTNPRVPVPLAPYGGVWSTGADTLPTPVVLKAFESQIVGATRHATAPKDTVNGPTFFDPVTHKGVNGGFAKSPEGLLVQLNDNSSNLPGTINTLFLAKSPNDSPLAGAAQLAFQGFNGNKVVSPALSAALMNNNLFMVVTNYNPKDPQTPLGGFENEIQVGEWTFRLDVGFTTDQQTTPKTILVFKFTTAFSVVDLVANAAYWQEWQTFIGPDPATVKTVQGQLNQYLCTANPNGKNPNNPYGGALFADFWTKVTDPNWTGILAINCGLDDADLPDDLQDLLGGIDGELRAHHFGITVNRIKGADSASWEIDQSSLFALVHYQKNYEVPQPPTAPFGFQVLKLNALFENSALVHFDSRIAVTIPQLFGTDVVLTTPSGDPNVPAGYNVIEIDGVYQKHGDTGTVVFDTKTPQVFSFKTSTSTGFRALSEVYVTDAALVPVSSVNQSGTITVVSSFALSGVLIFADDVSQDSSGLDLFSYGNAQAPAGLGFAAYNIGMTTQIQNNVGKLLKIGPDLSSFRVTPATSPVREGSLVAALPLKLISFVQSPQSTGWPVTFKGQSTNTFAATYALQFQVSLGSLGALSAVADSLDVDLMLCWQTATGADNDQLWLLMVPPQTMLGRLGFGLEGVLDTTFQSVEVVAQTWPAEAPPEPVKVYGVYFNNVQIQLLGISLTPGTTKFVLFADPSQGNTSNMGWLMTMKASDGGGG
jgi:hypothetical protein